MENNHLCKSVMLAALLLISQMALGQTTFLGQSFNEASASAAQEKLITLATGIPADAIATAATQQGGRLKPFDTLARETLLFLTGKYTRWQLSSEQLYLGLLLSDSSPWLQLIEIREPELRTELGFLKTQRLVSVAELESAHLAERVQPFLQQQQENSHSLTALQKSWIELYNQFSLMKAVLVGEHLIGALDFSHLEAQHSGHTVEGTKQAVTTYLEALRTGGSSTAAADALVTYSRSQDVPELFQHSLKKLETEVLFNKLSLFFWTSILYLLLASVLIAAPFVKKLDVNWVTVVLAVPLVLQVVGLGIRVYITRFAPITNMYATMIWVSFGVNLFSLILYRLYKNTLFSGIMLFTSGLVLLLAQSFPLVLSPDLDPIVAVLRSNFWLSTHVTTITISYAAFSIAMVLGNFTLVASLLGKQNSFIAEFEHHAYRAIQLGCFLLTVGIILGGIWADYSWGRFWGWDPKETWALIADLSFLALLHSRFLGWARGFVFLALCPVAYLMVLMAWYGVNFILAAGLHSYGFSSGGAMAVAIFVTLQLILLGAGLTRVKFQRS